MTPDEEWEQVTRRDRDTGPVQKREMDSLSAQMADILDGLGKANRGIEGTKKNLSGIWGLVVVAVVGIWYVSQFVGSYQSMLINGSPFSIAMKGELKADIATVKKIDDDRYDKLSDILRSQMEANTLVQQQLNQVDKRLTRLEDHK